MGVLSPQALGSRALLCKQSWDWKDSALHGAAGLELGLHPTWAGLIAIKISLHSIPLSQGQQKLKANPVWNQRNNLGLKLCWNKQGSSHSRAQGGSTCRAWWVCRSYLGSGRLFSFPSHLPGHCYMTATCAVMQPLLLWIPHSYFIQVSLHSSVEEQGGITILTGYLRLMSKLCKWVIPWRRIGAHWWMQKALVHISIKNLEDFTCSYPKSSLA